MIRIRVICQSYFIDSTNKLYKIIEKQVVLNPYLSTGLSECGKAKLEVNKHLVIPATDPNGKQVTGIAPKAFYKKGIWNLQGSQTMSGQMKSLSSCRKKK